MTWHPIAQGVFVQASIVQQQLITCAYVCPLAPDANVCDLTCVCVFVCVGTGGSTSRGSAASCETRGYVAARTSPAGPPSPPNPDPLLPCMSPLFVPPPNSPPNSTLTPVGILWCCTLVLSWVLPACACAQAAASAKNASWAGSGRGSNRPMSLAEIQEEEARQVCACVCVCVCVCVCLCVSVSLCVQGVVGTR